MMPGSKGLLTPTYHYNEMREKHEKKDTKITSRYHTGGSPCRKYDGGVGSSIRNCQKENGFVHLAEQEKAFYGKKRNIHIEGESKTGKS